MKTIGRKLTSGIVAVLLSLSVLFTYAVPVYAADNDTSGTASETVAETQNGPDNEITAPAEEPEAPVEEPQAPTTGDAPVEPAESDIPTEPETEPAFSLEVSFSQGALDGDGNQLLVSVNVNYSADSFPESDDSYVLYAYAGTTNKNEKVSANGTVNFKPFNISGNETGKTYDVYAVLKNGEEVLAESTHKTITVIKPKISKSAITVESSYDGEETGTVTVAGFSKVAYYREQVGNVVVVDNGVITGLAKGTYYVYTPAYTDGDTYYIASSKQKVTVDSEARPEYIVSASDGDTFYWSKHEVSILKGAGSNVYVRLSNEDYYISRVYAEPAENAEISWYEPTGEVSISNITGNITLYAETVKKPTPAEISVVSVSFNKEGIYSEENPYIQTEIIVKVTDENGTPVPSTEVYYKADESELSYITRETGEDGTAVFKNSYGIGVEKGDTTASYKALFSTDTGFETLTAATDINLILQQKKNLVLYTDQIVGSRPEVHEGKVTGVPDGYEIWRGEVHDGALVLYSGVWEGPTDGEFTGLSSGLNLIRFGEKYDEETNTFWFASDHDIFEVPRLNNAPVTEEEPVNTDDGEQTSGGTNTTPSQGIQQETAPAQTDEPAGNNPANTQPTNPRRSQTVNNGNADTQEEEEQAEPEEEQTEESEEEQSEPENSSEEEPVVTEEPKAETASIADENTALAAGPVSAEVPFNFTPLYILGVLILLAAGAYAYYKLRKKAK